MDDKELAIEIERHLAPDAIYWHWEPSMADMEQIIAALRRADLAQTEIKGHMRVKDDLQARVAELEKDAASMSDGLNGGVCSECRGYRCHVLPCGMWEISRKYLSEPPDATLKSRA